MAALTPQQHNLLQRLAAAKERGFDFVSLHGGDKVTVRALFRTGLAERARWWCGARITDKGLAALTEAT